MEEVQEKRLQITDQVARELSSIEAAETDNRNRITQKINYKRWFRIVLYTFFVLLGQSVAVLLGRLYFNKGGKSKWLGTLVQLAGFPILLPYYLIPATKQNNNILQSKQPTLLKLALIYLSLGLILAADCYLYSIGLMYLPVSTYSLICSSQLAFNAVFSYFLNSQKFTPFIINSLVILTVSSTLLVFQTDEEGSVNDNISKGKYVIGFICTVAASAGYGLVLSLTQLIFNKVIKSESFKVVVDMAVCRSAAACGFVVVGLFASGEWRGLKSEMNEFELGKVSYVMTVVWTAILWKVYTVGCVGLIFEVSSLFSNAIGVLGSPIIPIAAVIFFHDRMNGLKAIAMVLAVWGFISYLYQQYLDDCESKVENSKDENKD